MSAPATDIQTSPTPILDRLQPLPKMEGRAARSVMVVLVIWSVIFIFGFFLYSWRDVPIVHAVVRGTTAAMNGMFPHEWTPLTVALFFPLVLAATFAAVAIHEAAHAIVGVLAGFRFNSLRVGRLQFDRPFRISFYRGRGTGSGGWASLFPVKHDRLIVRATAMLLAGPLSNLISVGLLLALSYRKGLFSALFIDISLILGLMNLVPFRSRAVISDGGRIFMLLANRARGERWLAIIKLVEEMRSGVPAEKMTPEFLARAVAIEDESPDTVVAFAIAFASAFWQHKNDEAAQALETCLRHAKLAAPSQRVGLMTDAAVFQARRRKRIDLAEQWLADTPEKTEFTWMRPRAEAAILEARGDIAAARRKLDEIETIIRGTPNQALREMSLRNVARWRAELPA